MDKPTHIASQTPSPQPAAELPPAPAVAAPAEEAKKDRKQKRTLGLKIFDIFLYPLLTNFGVFTISVGATYLTTHGDKHHLLGLGPLLKKRGDDFKTGARWLSKKTNVNISGDTIEMAKTVAFSFFDGSLFAPLVKLLEDRRERIAKWIDTKLGTKPEDESVYAAEPKQSWGSVWLGRLATFLIVFPTAVALDKKTVNQMKQKIDVDGNPMTCPETGHALMEPKNLNDVMFRDAGAKANRYVSSKWEWYRGLQNKFNTLDFDYLFKVAAFEGFYTSVCTLGLYVNSRLLARFFGERDKEKEQKKLAREGGTENAADGVKKNAPELKKTELKEATPADEMPAPKFAEALKRDTPPAAAPQFAFA